MKIKQAKNKFDWIAAISAAIGTTTGFIIQQKISAQGIGWPQNFIIGMVVTVLMATVAYYTIDTINNTFRHRKISKILNSQKVSLYAIRRS